MNSPGRAFIFESAASGSANANITYSEYLRIDSAGNVGINSADPSEKLDVNGTIQCLNELRSKSGQDLLLNAGSANRDVKVQVNDTNILYVKGSNASVGIGTDSPDNFLHVENGANTSNTYIHVQNSHSGGGNAGVKMQNVNGQWTIIANDRLRFYNDDGSAEPFSISSANVIGANTPTTITDLHTAYRAVQNHNYGVWSTDDGGASFLSNNAYINSSGNWVRLANDHASDFGMDDGNFYFRNVAAGTGTISWNQPLTITSGGDIGINNGSPNCKLSIYDSAEHTAFNSATPSVGDCMLQLYNNPANETANDHATIQFGINGGTHNRVNTISAVAESASNRKMSFVWCLDEGSGRTEKMRLTADGQLMLGRSVANAGNATGLGMEINGNSDYAMFVRSQATTLYIGRNNDHGTIVQFTDDGTSVGSVSTNGNSLPSDRNYKKNINSLSLGLNLIEKLNPVSYNYKFEKDGDPLKYGLIAQDLEQSLEEVGVEKDSASILQYSEEAENDPNLKNDQSKYNLCYEKLIPVLINSVKELKAENDELKSLIKNSSTFAKLKSSL
jgi:hypothetical protein